VCSHRPGFSPARSTERLSAATDLEACPSQQASQWTGFLPVRYAIGAEAGHGREPGEGANEGEEELLQHDDVDPSQRDHSAELTPFLATSQRAKEVDTLHRSRSHTTANGQPAMARSAICQCRTTSAPIRTLQSTAGSRACRWRQSTSGD